MAAGTKGKDDALAQALARIEELNRRMGLDPADDPVLAAHRPAPPLSQEAMKATGSALELATQRMIDALKKMVSTRQGEIRKERGRLERWIRMRDRATDDETRQQAQEYIDEDSPEIEEKVAAYESHIEVLEARIARLENAPTTMFLPLGTIVRFTDAKVHKSSLMYGDPNQSYPVPGTVGVVTRLNHDMEYPIEVSVRREFKYVNGDTGYPQYDRFHKFGVDPDKIEVIGPGLLPDGTPCTAYGWLPTHMREQDSVLDKDEPHEMVIEADGFFWRFHEFHWGNTEVMQAFDSMEDMPWITGPLAGEEAEEQSVPGPQ